MLNIINTATATLRILRFLQLLSSKSSQLKDCSIQEFMDIIRRTKTYNTLEFKVEI